MSFKAIDLQMAIHRNDEAGQRQNQLMHKPEVDQSQLARESLKQAEREQHRVMKLEDPSQAHLRRSGGDGASQRQGSRRKLSAVKPTDSEPPDTKAAPHPYKGHFIDLCL